MIYIYIYIYIITKNLNIIQTTMYMKNKASIFVYDFKNLKK